jgi:hypothetical protein
MGNIEDAPVSVNFGRDGCIAALDRVPFRAGDERPGGNTDDRSGPGEHVGTNEQKPALRP